VTKYGLPIHKESQKAKDTEMNMGKRDLDFLPSRIPCWMACSTANKYLQFRLWRNKPTKPRNRNRYNVQL